MRCRSSVAKQWQAAFETQGVTFSPDGRGVSCIEDTQLGWLALQRWSPHVFRIVATVGAFKVPGAIKHVGNRHLIASIR